MANTENLFETVTLGKTILNNLDDEVPYIIKSPCVVQFF